MLQSHRTVYSRLKLTWRIELMSKKKPKPLYPARSTTHVQVPDHARHHDLPHATQTRASQFSRSASLHGHISNRLATESFSPLLMLVTPQHLENLARLALVFRFRGQKIGNWASTNMLLRRVQILGLPCTARVIFESFLIIHRRAFRVVSGHVALEDNGPKHQVFLHCSDRPLHLFSSKGPGKELLGRHGHVVQSPSDQISRAVLYSDGTATFPGGCTWLGSRR
jgi:hypothetical protein